MKRILAALVSMLVILSTLSAISLLGGTASATDGGPTLNPLSIPKYVNQLVIPPVYKPVNTDPHIQKYIVEATQFFQQILPSGFPQTKVWGYGGLVWENPLTGQPGYFRFSPGPTFETTRNIPVMVKWMNSLKNGNTPLHHILPVDPTLHWADPNNMGMPMPPFTPFPPGYAQAQSPVPLVTHLHGAEVKSTSDGGPDQWFTPNGIHGEDYFTAVSTTPNAAVYSYPNRQLPTTLFYHDHALGMTRLNVYSGLAGFYIIRDPNDPVTENLPDIDHEIPLAIQDRSFNTDGSLWFPTEGINPDIHPYWNPEFFGNTIMVNGKIWPNHNVKPEQYRLRLVDGSNARFYDIAFQNKQTGAFLSFKQIGGDGSYLPNSVTLTHVLFAPGERIDLVVDFSGLPCGTKIIMRNNAKAPFPDGDPVDPQTTGQIMQFTIQGSQSEPHITIPTHLINIPQLIPNVPAKTLTLFEVQGPNGPEEILLDGQKWSSAVSELPRVGSTVDWKIVNPTMDTHPIHLHLVQFQLVSRQKIDIVNYTADWIQANGGVEPPFTNATVHITVTPYLIGNPSSPRPNERGWKDTYQVNPGEVTTFRIRFAPQDTPVSGPGSAQPGVNRYPFNPTIGPGYVWHCHIIDHEDNEMMRPYLVTP